MLQSFSLNKCNFNHGDEKLDVCEHPGHVRGSEMVEGGGSVMYFGLKK